MIEQLHVTMIRRVKVDEVFTVIPCTCGTVEHALIYHYCDYDDERIHQLNTRVYSVTKKLKDKLKHIFGEGIPCRIQISFYREDLPGVESIFAPLPVSLEIEDEDGFCEIKTNFIYRWNGLDLMMRTKYIFSRYLKLSLEVNQEHLSYPYYTIY